MSNSKIWFEQIEQIAQTPSKNEKVELLKKFCEDDGFRDVLVTAIDPLITYGVAKKTLNSIIGDSFTTETKNFDSFTSKVLNDLSKRILTGEAAIKVIGAELASLNPESALLLRRILLKDLRAGISESSVNKACEGLIREFPYQRCSLPKDAKFDTWTWKEGVFSQEKADGMYVNINYDISGLVQIAGRSGHQFPLDEFHSLIRSVKNTFTKGYQYHGELLVVRDGQVLAREIGNGILNSVLAGGAFAENEKPIYQVWDQIPLTEAIPGNKHKVPYRARFKLLAQQLIASPEHLSSFRSIHLIPTRIVHSIEEAYAHYFELLKLDKEGTIIKNSTAIWRDGTSKEQVKLKLEVDVDLIITGFTEGNGKNEATFGSIVCQSQCGQLEVAVSGFKAPKRAAIHAKREEIIGTVMTVRGNGVMYPSKEGKAHSLFLPRFIEFRKDKSEGDTLQMVIDQFESAVRPKEKVAA